MPNGVRWAGNTSGSMASMTAEDARASARNRSRGRRYTRSRSRSHRRRAGRKGRPQASTTMRSRGSALRGSRLPPRRIRTPPARLRHLDQSNCPGAPEVHGDRPPKWRVRMITRRRQSRSYQAARSQTLTATSDSKARRCRGSWVCKSRSSIDSSPIDGRRRCSAY